jgi:hypothetical protein
VAGKANTLHELLHRENKGNIPCQNIKYIYHLAQLNSTADVNHQAIKWGNEFNSVVYLEEAT